MADIKKALVLKKYITINTSIYSYKKQLITWWSTNYITIKLYLKKENSLDLNPCIKYSKINFRCYRST